MFCSTNASPWLVLQEPTTSAGGAFDRLAAAGALHWRAVDQRQIVMESRALAREDPHEPLQRLRQPASAFEVAGLHRQLGNRCARRLPATARNRRSEGIPMIACATQSVTTSASVTLRAGFLVRSGSVGRDEHGREQQVKVSVHRGPLGSAMPISTADFAPAALYSSKTPTNTATGVESTI
jgi:hypothetical protein